MKTLKEMCKDGGWKEGLATLFVLAFIVGMYFVLAQFQA